MLVVTALSGHVTIGMVCEERKIDLDSIRQLNIRKLNYPDGRQNGPSLQAMLAKNLSPGMQEPRETQKPGEQQFGRSRRGHESDSPQGTQGYSQ